MNKEYTYIDGKVIVEDTEGNKRQVEYSDNLDKILVEENRIEVLEDKIKTLEEASRKYKKDYKSNKIYPWIVLSIFTLMPTLCFKVLFPMIFGNNIGSDILGTEASTFIGTMDFDSFASIFFTAYLTPLGILLSSAYFRRNKYDLKSEKGRELALKSLKEELVLAKENLEIMKQEKTEVNKVEEDFRIEKVKDTEVLNYIEGSINLYHDLGHNGEKYYRYYQKHGKLPKKVEEHYTELGQEMIVDFIEEHSSYLDDKGYITPYTKPKTRTRKRYQ